MGKLSGLAAIAIAGLATALSAGRVQADDALIAAGQALAEESCSGCHAVGTEGDSPREGAPRFRELSRNYPIETLEEALAEGIVTAHPDMPQIEMTPEEIGAFLAYLQSIQTKP